MNHQYQSVICKFLAGLIIVFVCSSTIFPYFTNNHTEIAFTGDPTLDSTLSLEEFVVTGAGYFLESYSYMLSAMQKVELSHPGQYNPQELIPILDNTIQSLKKANEAYTTLKQMADLTPYNPRIIEFLLAFDYDGFSRSMDWRLHTSDQVKRILAIGDVRAIYSQMVTDTASILDTLNQFKVNVETGQFPDIPTLWKINQAYTDTLLFGQYVAQVFDKALAEM